MMSCNPVNTPMECGVKLSKEDGERKIDPDHISESYWKPKVLNMYQTRYTIFGGFSESVYGESG
jgi:hypothetical protein